MKGWVTVGWKGREGKGRRGQNWALMLVTAEDGMNKSISLV
jgi:hypothetical protein